MCLAEVGVKVIQKGGGREGNGGGGGVLKRY